MSHPGTWPACILIDYRNGEDIPVAVATAAKVLSQNRMHQRRRRNQLTELGLAPKTRQSRLEGLARTKLPRLEEPYPPPDRDIYETEEIAEIWRNHRAHKKHPDRRGKFGDSWPKLERLDDTKLGLVVGVDESVIVYDAESGDVVAVVIRDFVGNDEILEWISGIVDENVGLRRGIRVLLLAEPVSWR